MYLCTYVLSASAKWMNEWIFVRYINTNKCCDVVNIAFKVQHHSLFLQIAQPLAMMYCSLLHALKLHALLLETCLFSLLPNFDCIR